MSGLIPQPFIDELLNRSDLVELIDGYVPLKKRGNSYTACCPFHNENNPSFNVVAKKQFYHCFGCGASGNAISFVMNYLHQNFIEAIDTLAARAGMQVPRENNPEKTQQSLSLYQLLQKVNLYYQNTLKQSGELAINYLRQRGVSGQIAKKYELGYAPAGWQLLEKHFKTHKKDLITAGMLIHKEGDNTYDRYRNRIMFPIHDRHGRIIGFGGRSIDKEQMPKYLNSPETIIFQKNRELYGLHQLLQNEEKNDHILIVEGYMDVIALAQYGINNAVASLGTATSTYHIQLLSKHTQKLIFCFDGDRAGRQAAWRALENSLPQLGSGIDAHFSFLPEGYDPDSLIREEGAEKFKQRLQTALPLSQFFLDTLSQDIDVQSIAGKSQLLNAVKPYMQTIPDSTYRQLLINELSRLTRIENHRLNELMQTAIENKSGTTEKKIISRSPIRLAIALLIQNPEIYHSCEQAINVTLLDGEGQETLKQLLKQVASSPHSNTATLLESWRNHALFDSLTKLAGWDHQVPEEALNKEFIDILIFLQKQNLETKINQYITKSRKQGLTIAERKTLQEMLQRRHQTVHDKN